MEKFLDVIVILAAVAVMVLKAYRKNKTASRPQIDPRRSPEPVVVEPAAEPSFENLPPIPPLAREMAVEQEETPAKEKEREKEENNPAETPAAPSVNPLLGMDLRQAVIASEILKRKF